MEKNYIPKFIEVDDFPKDLRELPITQLTTEELDRKVEKIEDFFKNMENKVKGTKLNKSDKEDLSYSLRIYVNEYINALIENYNLKLILEASNPDLFMNVTQKDYNIFAKTNWDEKMNKFFGKRSKLKKLLNHNLSTYRNDKYYKTILDDIDKFEEFYLSYLRWRNRLKNSKKNKTKSKLIRPILFYIPTHQGVITNEI